MSASRFRASEYWIVFKRDTAQVQSIEITARTIDWLTINRLAKERIDLLKAAVLDAINRTYWEQWARLFFDQALDWVRIRETGVTRAVLGKLGAAVDKQWELDQDLKNEDPEVRRAARAKIMISAAMHKEEESEWIRSLQRRQEFLLRKKKDTGLDAEEVAELKLTTEQLSNAHYSADLTNFFQNFDKSIIQENPASLKREGLVTVRESIQNGQLGRDLLAHYLMEELFYMVLAP